jgi:hypothetical protein
LLALPLLDEVAGAGDRRMVLPSGGRDPLLEKRILPAMWSRRFTHLLFVPI